MGVGSRWCGLGIGHITCSACVLAMVRVPLVSTERLGASAWTRGEMGGVTVYLALPDETRRSGADGMAFARQICQCITLVQTGPFSTVRRTPWHVVAESSRKRPRNRWH
jgi:hypothetical protein